MIADGGICVHSLLGEQGNLSRLSLLGEFHNYLLAFC